MGRWRGLAVVLAGWASLVAAEVRAETPLTVFAASSLRGVFRELGRQFEASHPGVALRFQFAGSQELRAQLEHGARADLFAAADELQIGQLRHRRGMRAPVVFARNTLVLVVARRALGRVRSLADLPTAERIVLGSAGSPIGRYTQQVLELAGKRWGADFAARVQAKVVSRESQVKQVWAKVQLGEVDAGIVYRTDVEDGANAAVIELPADCRVRTAYQAAALVDAPQPDLAEAWLGFLRSPAAQAMLQRAGFLPAGAPGTAFGAVR